MGYLVIPLVGLLLALANQSEMAPSGKTFGGDEGSTFKETEALGVPGQRAKLGKTWAAQRRAGILLLARDGVRYQLLPFRAGKIPLVKPKLDFFFCPWDCSALSHLGGYQL